MKTKTLQEQYNNIKEGKGNKSVFLKEAKALFPHLINNVSSFEEATTILQQRSIISENIWGVVTGPAKQPDWFSIFNENLTEVKAEEKKTSKEVEDIQAKGYNSKDKKNVNNTYGQEFLSGYYVEMKCPKNADKTVDELLALVAKNLDKDPLFYVKDGQFGVKGVGYSDQLPGLKASKEIKGKYKSSGYGDMPKPKKNLNENVEAETDYEIKPFLDAIKIADNSITLDQITVESTPKGNWTVYVDGKRLNVVNGKLLNDELIMKYNLEHHDEDMNEGFYSSPSDIPKTGLTVTAREQFDTQKISDALENSSLHAEWNAREGYFFFPEEEENYDKLEKELNNLLDTNDINARIEGIWNESMTPASSFKPGSIALYNHQKVKITRNGTGGRLYFKPVNQPGRAEEWAKVSDFKKINEFEDESQENLNEKEMIKLTDLLSETEYYMSYEKKEKKKPLKKEVKKEVKKSFITSKIKEIEQHGSVAALEAKINALDEEIDNRELKLKMIGENEDLAEFINPGRVKEMEKEIKELQKVREREQKIYEKMTGGTKKEIIDEDDENTEIH